MSKEPAQSRDRGSAPSLLWIQGQRAQRLKQCDHCAKMLPAVSTLGTPELQPYRIFFYTQSQFSLPPLLSCSPHPIRYSFFREGEISHGESTSTNSVLLLEEGSRSSSLYHAEQGISLLDEGSMMTIKIVTNLLTGEGQFRHPFHYCLDS